MNFGLKVGCLIGSMKRHEILKIIILNKEAIEVEERITFSGWHIFS